MPHSQHALEKKYDLTSKEILDAVSRHFRAKVALEGVIAETHLEKIVKRLKASGVIDKYETRDKDGQPDIFVWLPDRAKPLRIECKNVRNSDEAFRHKGKIVAFKVETQKTRASQGDASSRFYGADQFEILAVCLGKKTGNWKEFVFIPTKKLARHAKHPKKLAVMHRVPLSENAATAPWFGSLKTLLEAQIK